jgi:hypothetical protein
MVASLTKFGGTETDTATPLATTGETPATQCLNFALIYAMLYYIQKKTRFRSLVFFFLSNY